MSNALCLIQNGGYPPSWILKTGLSGGEGINIPHYAKFCGNRSNHSWNMAIFLYFQTGDHSPSWICSEHVWTTQKECLMVLITVQNFVGINAVVSKICKCWFLTSLAWKCVFTPPKWRFFGGLYHINGYHDPKKPSPCLETPRNPSYRSLRSVQPFLQPPKLYALQWAIHSPKSAPSHRSICIPI